MPSMNDAARPRYLPLTATRRLEVDYLLDAPTKPVALTVVDRAGREIRNDGWVIALAWRLTRGRRRPQTLVTALEALLEVALRLQRERAAAEHAWRNALVAGEHDALDVDAPIPFAPTEDLRDPEAPEPWRMDGEHCDEFAAEFAEHRRAEAGRLDAPRRQRVVDVATRRRKAAGQ